jgi:glyoxylate reductase
MPRFRPRVIVTRRLPEPIEAALSAEFDTSINQRGPLSRDALATALRDGDVLACTVTDRLDAAMLSEAGPQLKLLANFGVGVDHIDLAAARQRGILVSNTPDVLTDDTADLTLAKGNDWSGAGNGAAGAQPGRWEGA